MTMDWNKATKIAANWISSECDPHGTVEPEYYAERAMELIANIRMAESLDGK